MQVKAAMLSTSFLDDSQLTFAVRTALSSGLNVNKGINSF